MCVCVVVDWLQQASLHICRFNGWNSAIHISLSLPALISCYKPPEIRSVYVPL